MSPRVTAQVTTAAAPKTLPKIAYILACDTPATGTPCVEAGIGAAPRRLRRSLEDSSVSDFCCEFFEELELEDFAGVGACGTMLAAIPCFNSRVPEPSAISIVPWREPTMTSLSRRTISYCAFWVVGRIEMPVTVDCVPLRVFTAADPLVNSIREFEKRIVEFSDNTITLPLEEIVAGEPWRV